MNIRSLRRRRALIGIPIPACAIALFACASAHAQCRVGAGPDFGDGIPYCSELPPDDYEVPQGPAWESRWGAIAIDPGVTEGGIGVASDMKSRRAAEKVALRNCRKSGGGKTCRIEVSYDNQCGVIAWGDTYMNAANSETLEAASSLALQECGKRTGHCRVFYANCSYPVRIR